MKLLTAAEVLDAVQADSVAEEKPKARQGKLAGVLPETQPLFSGGDFGYALPDEESASKLMQLKNGSSNASPKLQWRKIWKNKLPCR